MDKSLRDKFSGTGKALPETLVIDHVSAATRLLEKRRQMFEVQEALNSQKEEFTRREDAFRRREEALRRKDLELQESLIKFNRFLQENEVFILLSVSTWIPYKCVKSRFVNSFWPIEIKLYL